jgi:hypothetical protein
MEEYKKDDRGRSKAKRLTMNDPHTKVDSSTWTPDAAENAGVKTGARPLVKRLYKKGGKVVGKHEGKDAVKHAGRMPRKAGGRTNTLSPDSLINRDVRTANEAREGTKHIGGFKKGGKAHKFGGGPIGDNPVGEQNRMMGKAAGMMKKGGRAKHATDGKVKPTGIEPDFRPSKYGETKVSYSDDDKNAVSNLAKYGSIKGNPTASPDYPERKSGGKVKHTDEVQDKKLMHKVLKPTVFKAKGGEAMHHKDCTCKMCGGGRTMKYSGGGIFSGDSKKKVPGDVGGRQARASGGGFGEAFKAARAAMLEGGPKTFEFNGKQYSTDLAKATPSGGSRNVGMGKADAARAAQAMRSENTRDYGQERAAASRSAMAADPEMQSIVNRTPGDFNVGPTRANEPKAVVGNILRNQMKPTGEEPLSFGYADDANYPKGSAQNQANMERSSSVVPENEFPGYPGSRKAGGRTHHAKGGRTKGKTNINIIIGAGHSQKPPMPMGMGEMPNAPVSPRTPPAAGMPPQGMPPMGPQGAPPMPPQGGMPMPRKHGGRTGYPIETGSGGANARLEKIDAYGLKPPRKK